VLAHDLLLERGDSGRPSPGARVSRAATNPGLSGMAFADAVGVQQAFDAIV